MPRAAKIEAKLSWTIILAAGVISAMIKARAAGTAVVTMVMTVTSSPLQRKCQCVRGRGRGTVNVPDSGDNCADDVLNETSGFSDDEHGCDDDLDCATI